MKLFRNTDADSLMPVLVTSGFLLIITAFFVPAVAIMFIQDMLFFSSDHWSFIRPDEAFIGFGAGMIWMGVLLLSILLTKMYAEKKDMKYKLTGIHLVLLALAIPIFVLSVYHYSYLDENGVEANTFWTLSEDKIAWNDVEGVTRLVEEGSYRIFSYTFTSSDTSITIPYDPQDQRTIKAIDRAIYAYNWEVVDIVEEREEESVTFGE